MYVFPDHLRSALNRLVERANAEYADPNAPGQWPLSAPASELADAEVVRRGLRLLGHEVDVQAAFAVWELYSEDLSAGWIDGPTTPEEALAALEGLCENIEKGQDYAGFSSVAKG